MTTDIILIGFGEAGSTFAAAGDWRARACAYDRDPARGDIMAQLRVTRSDALSDAVRDSGLVVSLVTADQALAVARDVAAFLPVGAIFCDMNSVAPQTKQAAAGLVEAAGGHYVDVAVMAPVDPAGLDVPLLLSGGQAADAKARLQALGFAKTRVVGADVGRASSIKMIRSVMVKGIEALTAECVLAADAADVLDEVLASLDASEKAKPWGARADYNLDRMLVHGTRRAAEMEEVVKMLDGLGTGAAMTRGTVVRQATIGGLGVKVPPDGLGGKIARIVRDTSLRHVREGGDQSPALVIAEMVEDGFPPSRE
jgi:3-hydroxyisobutyrate dehydrogenase-like beta-hydroxyacid dehydrogenase